MRRQPIRDPITGQPTEGGRALIETKEFFRTSEFFVLVVMCFGLMIAAAAVETFDVVDVAPLLTLLGAAYMLSRGVAKAGTQHPFTGRESIGELRERIGMRSDASLSQRVEEPVYTGQPVAQAPQGYASAGGTEPVPPPHVGIRGPSDDPYHERPV